jgi:hypothetical protein
MQRPEQARSGSPGGWIPPATLPSLARLASERRWLRGDGFEPPSGMNGR